MIVTDALMECATASIVLGKIEDSGDAGYVPAPEERTAIDFLSRERLIFKRAERQDPHEGYATRWRWYVLDNMEGGN